MISIYFLKLLLVPLSNSVLEVLKIPNFIVLPGLCFQSLIVSAIVLTDSSSKNAEQLFDLFTNSVEPSSKEERSEIYGSFKGKHHKEETKNKVRSHHKMVRDAYLKNNMGLNWNQFQKYYKENIGE